MGRLSTVQPLAALDTEAVTAKVVVAARRAHEPARGVGLQPPLAFSAVPDAILGAQHPAPPLAVKDRKVAHREAERASLK